MADTKQKRAQILEDISFQAIALKAGTVYQTVSKFVRGENIRDAKKAAIIEAAIRIREKQIDAYIEDLEALQKWQIELKK